MVHLPPGKTAKALVCEFIFVHSLLWWWIVPPCVPSLLWTLSPLAPSFCSPPLRTPSLLHWSMSTSIHTWPDRPVFRSSNSPPWPHAPFWPPTDFFLFMVILGKISCTHDRWPSSPFLLYKYSTELTLVKPSLWGKIQWTWVLPCVS